MSLVQYFPVSPKTVPMNTSIGKIKLPGVEHLFQGQIHHRNSFGHDMPQPPPVKLPQRFGQMPAVSDTRSSFNAYPMPQQQPMHVLSSPIEYFHGPPAPSPPYLVDYSNVPVNYQLPPQQQTHQQVSVPQQISPPPPQHIHQQQDPLRSASVYYFPSQQGYMYLPQPQQPDTFQSLPKQATAWSSEDDILLKHLKEVKKLGWREISAHFPKRTPNACQFRWRRIIAGVVTNKNDYSSTTSGTILSSGKGKKSLSSIRRKNFTSTLLN